MNKNLYRVIGVMSGTSLDGVDLACINFKYDTNWQFKIECFDTVSYNQKWRKVLQGLTLISQSELLDVDAKYTEYIGGIINKFITNHNLINIDAICSHGHTAQHQPNEGITYQIGNQKELAGFTNNKVVCDFRIQDVKFGGQGAPLVPIGDSLLFSEYDYCLNLGGFANVSFEEDSQRIAFDICPVNIVLNHYVEKLGLDYDDEGRIAATGLLNKKLLDDLNNLEFYGMEYPKSLGLEWVNKKIFPIINSYNLNIEDILNTFVEHIAIQISNVFRKENATVFITGGGAFNNYLMSRLKLLSHTNSIITPSKDLINYKEALIFGLLGVLKMRNEVNCLSSVTGAKHDHCSGRIYLP